MSMMLRTLPIATLIVCLALVSLAQTPAPEPEIIGYATIVDGDTIKVQGFHIRLFGIDAPELEQVCTDDRNQLYRCGLLATDVLNEIIANQPVVCRGAEIDQYGRTVAICKVRGHDLGAAMVERGYALDYTYFSKGHYAKEQAHAMQAKSGIWIGTFKNPREWRKEHPRD